MKYCIIVQSNRFGQAKFAYGGSINFRIELNFTTVTDALKNNA